MSENPATFCGFEEPKENWSKLPHDLIAALPLVDTVGEMKVILYILRHTWGYHDTEKKITLDEFEHGRKRKDGTRLDGGTGLSRTTIADGLSRAEKHGFIEITVDDHDLGRIQKIYRLKDGGSEVIPQGARSCPSDSQKLHPREPEVDPRTEKETSETNLRIDTSEKEAPDGAVLPGDSSDIDWHDGATSTMHSELPKTANPYMFAAELEARGSGKQPWTVAGPEGADPYLDGPLDATLRILRRKRDNMAPKTQTSWARQLRVIVEGPAKEGEIEPPIGGTPDLFLIACRLWPKAFEWKDKSKTTYTNVYKGAFVNDMRTLMRQIQGGKTGTSRKLVITNA